MSDPPLRIYRVQGEVPVLGMPRKTLFPIIAPITVPIISPAAPMIITHIPSGLPLLYATNPSAMAIMPNNQGQHKKDSTALMKPRIM